MLTVRGPPDNATIAAPYGDAVNQLHGAALRA
jgi:hypothetical protein